MTRRPERVVLIPRHTTFAGATEFLSAPMWVRPYGSFVGAMWRGYGFGTAGNEPVVTFELQRSDDLYLWGSTGVIVTPTTDEELSFDGTLQMDWIRCRVAVAGADPVVTVWAVADLIPRET